MRWIPWIVLVLCGAAMAQEAPAPASSAEAQRHAEQAEALFKEGKFAAARGEFEKARGLSEALRDMIEQARLHGRVAECFAAEGEHVHAIEGCEQLNEVALRLLCTGRHVEALPLLEQELAIYRRVHDGDDERVAASMWIVADCLKSLGRHSEALPLLEQSLAMCGRLFEGDHAMAAECLRSIGECVRELGPAGDALPLYESSLAMRRRLFAGDHEDIAMGLKGLASCLASAGRPDQALPLYEESLAMCQRLFPEFPDEDPRIAWSLMHVGKCLVGLGRPEDGLPYLEKSLASFQRTFRNQQWNVDPARDALAWCLLHLGRPGEALDVAARIDLKAGCLMSMGRPADALPLHYESLGILRRLYAGDHWLVAVEIGNVASCLSALGRRAEALPLYEEALVMARRLESPDKYGELAKLAYCLLAMGKAAEAIGPLEEAVAQIECLRGEATGLTEEDRAAYFGTLKLSGAYELLIRALRAIGHDSDALSFLERARARSLLDTLERGRADPLEEARRRAEERNDAEVVQQIGEARKSLEAADVEVARLTHALARMGPTGADTRERKDEARKLTAELAAARRAQQDGLRQRAQLIRGEFAAARPADAAALQRLAGADGRVLEYAVSEEESTLFVVPPAGSAIRAFRLAWRDGTAVTSKSLAEKVAAYGARMRAGGGEARGWFEEEAGAGGGVSGSDLFEALVPAEVREDVLKAKVVYVVADGALNRLPFETLVVAPGTFWMEGGPPLVYGASGSALLWSRERRDKQLSEGRLDGVVVVGDPVFRPAIEPPATGILVTGVAPEGQASRLGMRAGDVILAYDEKEIADIKALTEARAAAAIKEGSRKAGGIALAVWRAGERKDLAVEAGALGVNVAPDAMPEAWRRFQLGDPALARAALERTADLSRYGELRPLPGTRKEAEAIAEALKDLRVTVLLGESATHPAVLRAAPAARYLHFATHGLADETEMASYSSLALTLPAVPTAEDDGFLSLEDLFSRWRGKLGMCELVVLSACETQKGRIQKDEAVQALPVGFLFAGAPTVIATLWRVDDASAAELMGDFYRRLALGKGKLEAFTEARKALRKRHPDPYHWAPFVYIGDPR